jgi:xanthosine utilization system XapX-like protein
MWASEWAATVALSVVAYRDGRPATVALVAVLGMLPAAIVTPFAATLATTCSWASALSAPRSLGAAAGLLVAGAPSATVYASTALATLAQTLYRPAHSALLPTLWRRRTSSRARTSCAGCWICWATLAGPLAA